MHMSKKRRRDRLRNFSWTARGEASRLRLSQGLRNLAYA